MLHGEVAVYGTAIILWLCFWSRVAVECDKLFIIDMLSYENARVAS
ncbi:MAG: hypothetical protein WBB89_07435 [Candidatus Acidiferrum sp.]